jgi:hypothetical protein
MVARTRGAQALGMRRVAILITAFVLLAGVIRATSDAFEHHGHKTVAKPERGLRITAMDGAGSAGGNLRALAVAR